MNYDPWLEAGCTLAEARERTGDRGFLDRLRCCRAATNDHQARTNAAALERMTASAFCSLLEQKRPIAYGRKNDPSATSELMPCDLWPGLSVDWLASSVRDDEPGGSAYDEVCVFSCRESPLMPF